MFIDCGSCLSIFKLVSWSLGLKDEVAAYCKVASVCYSAICFALIMVSFLCSFVPGSGIPFAVVDGSNLEGTT